jgi:hypothetical protein
LIHIAQSVERTKLPEVQFRHFLMGASGSNEAHQPPPASPPPVHDFGPDSHRGRPGLERTLTAGAVDVMTSQLRRIRNERAELKAELEDAIQDLELAQEMMVRTC